MLTKGFLQKFISLRASLLAIVLLCWLLPTALLGTFIGLRFFGAMQEKTEAFLTTGAQQAQVRTLENIDKMVSLAKSVVYDGDLAAAVSGYESGKLNLETYFRLCRGYLERKYGREALCDFALFFRTAEPSTLFYTADDYSEATYFLLNAQPAMLEQSKALDTRCAFFAQDGRTYLARNLYNSRLELYGMLLLGLNEHQLFQPIREWCDQSGAAYALTLDGYGAGDLSYLDRPDGLSEEGDLLLYTLSSGTRDYALRFQVQANKRAVYREMEEFRTLMAWMLLLVVPLCIPILYFVNRRIVRPLAILSKASTRIQNGELGITVPIRGPDELGRLGNAFSNMSLQLKTLVDKSYKEEIALRDARIQAMQSRINPHFLNNALETINWQARMEESETVTAMVEALSLLLNASMDRGEQHLVPLREELKIADAYFYFVGLRFGDRLSVFRTVQEGLEERLIPRLVIQTLVENAIAHGIEPAGGGRILLNIFTQADFLVMEVVNNGKKLSPEGRQRIAKLLAEDKDHREHLGIRNVARRLHLLYGERASLTIGSDAHGETVATLRIPLEVSLGPSREAELSGSALPSTGRQESL